MTFGKSDKVFDFKRALNSIPIGKRVNLEKLINITIKDKCTQQSINVMSHADACATPLIG